MSEVLPNELPDGFTGAVDLLGKGPQASVDIDDSARWDRSDFVRKVQSYLVAKNRAITDSDRELLDLLVSQIEIYKSCTAELRAQGLVCTYNNGVTVGPNPYLNIADKALHRVRELMRELELTPRTRTGEGVMASTPDMQLFLQGP